MPDQTITLKTRDGKTSSATGAVTHYSSAARAMRGGGVAVVGTVLGLLTIVIPVVHLISTWLVPLVSWVLGFYVYSIETVLGPVTGPCPACGEALELEGGILADDTWVRCGKCQAPMQYEVGG